MKKLVEKLEGYSKVGIIVDNNVAWHCAIYEDGNTYEVGDSVIIAGCSYPRKITKIIDATDFKKSHIILKFEIIGKIDISAYEKRVEKRQKKALLEMNMKARKREIMENLNEECLASIDDKFAKLLEEYNKL
jgi:uncharacterized protein YktB (UPF0637 family)